MGRQIEKCRGKAKKPKERQTKSETEMEMETESKLATASKARPCPPGAVAKVIAFERVSVIYRVRQLEMGA